VIQSKINMGLEGVEYSERMECFDQMGPLLSDGGMCGGALPMDKGLTSALSLQPLDLDSQYQVLLQAQALLRKSELYQKIENTMRRVPYFRPNLHNLPHTSVDDDDRVTILHRDTAVSNLRFLNLFYGYSPSSFALSVNLLDRLLDKVKPQYLSCMAVACFYIAVKSQEEWTGAYIPRPAELVKLSQCGGSACDLTRMEQQILQSFQWQVDSAVTPLTFLHLFVQVLGSKAASLEQPGLLASVIAKLEVLMCQSEFAKFRAETLALALLSCVMQDMDLLGDLDLVTIILELQYYCQITEYEFLQCRSLITDFMRVYSSQRSKLPRLQLVWTVSRRTLSKMKPSQRILLDLETIMEDEDLEDDSDDAGPFDSENENDGHLDSPKITFTGGKGNRSQLPTMCTTATCKDNASRQNKNCFGQSFIKMHSKEKNNKNADM